MTVTPGRRIAAMAATVLKIHSDNKKQHRHRWKIETAIENNDENHQT